jgi:Dioxygenases related to 2-nitropropane dioxygenase
MSRIIDSLAIPILPAPMAGGPTTPEVVNAAASVGSFGTLAWGTISAQAAREQAEGLNTDFFGINLFAKQPELDSHGVAVARELAAAEGVELKSADYSNGWDEKLQLALTMSPRPKVVWSMFGTFTAAEVKALHAAGIEAWTTVTNEHEARAAIAAGVDALCVQGPEAGGHRGVWNPTAEPDKRPLAELVDAIAKLSTLPLIAAGGVRSADQVHEALTWPHVVAVSCGSAFLLSDEAGTSPGNRARINQVKNNETGTGEHRQAPVRFLAAMRAG